MDTKQIFAIPIAENISTENPDQKLKKIIEQTATKIEKYFEPLFAEFNKKFQDNQWILMQNKDVYYIDDVFGIMPNLYNFDSMTCLEHKLYSPDPDRLKFSGFQGDLLTETEARRCFNDKIHYFRNSEGNIARKGKNWYRGLTFKSGNFYKYMYTYNRFKYDIDYHGNKTDSDAMLSIPIFRFGKEDIKGTAEQAILKWIEFDLIPNFDSDSIKFLFNSLKNSITAYKSFLQTDGETFTFDRQKIFDAVKAGQHIEFLPTIDDLNDTNVADGNFEKAFQEKLLNCDFNRVGLDKYDKKILEDPTRGHWDLWDLSQDSKHKIELKKPIYARNPAADINAAGIVGIDFGTKSTVVVYENERGEIIPLQVGKGDYSKGVIAENYENPTIVEFIDIDKFFAAYQKSLGRPETSLNDVTVSHTAQTNLKNQTDSNVFLSYFDSIKQWCGNIQNEVKIKDQRGKEIDLKPFLELMKGEFNPLEIYAYYLGSYINHMLQPNHIFMKYILSFPVMYERNIRERMLKSFTAGLKKSLPTALLSNEEAMQKFQVVEGTSEPAAYAVTALEGYGFLNSGDQSDIYYAVFDFGGGTTDFDFGVLKLAEGDDLDFYDYVLTHFGAYGDRTLGGENLLKLLAFNVFKANKDKLLKPRENSKAKIPLYICGGKNGVRGL